VIIVPTKYYSTPTKVFRDNGFSIVIWANQMLRASITAMQKAAKMLVKEENLVNLEKDIVPVSEVFRLQGVSELSKAEKCYLPNSSKSNVRKPLFPYANCTIKKLKTAIDFQVNQSEQT
jgi:phosphoenolpyruvate phosphomutase